MGQGRIKRERREAAERGEQTTSTRAHRRDVFQRIRSGVAAIVVGAPVLQPGQAPQANFVSSITIVGSGFLIDNRGAVVTARHVIEPFVAAVQRAQAAGTPVTIAPPQVMLLGANGPPPAHDPANGPLFWEMGFTVMPVIHIHAQNAADIAILHCGDGSAIDPAVAKPLTISLNEAEEGDDVVACGYPSGRALHQDIYAGLVFSPSFSQGIVSALLPHPSTRPEARPFFQFDATIMGGSSGCAVCDVVTGEVVGLTVSVFSTHLPVKNDDGTQQMIDVPLGFPRAVPAALIRPFVAANPRPAGPSPR